MPAINDAELMKKITDFERKTRMSLFRNGRPSFECGPGRPPMPPFDDPHRPPMPPFDDPHRPPMPSFDDSHRPPMPPFDDPHRPPMPSFDDPHRPPMPPFDDPCRPPMPPFDDPHRPPMPPFGDPHRPPMPPHGHGPMRKPPLSREHLLVIIGKYPEGIRQKAIAEKAKINQSSTSELVNKLEADGYIVRKTDPNDKRATLLFLTELGQARAAEVEDERAEMFKDVFAVLTAEEKQTLSDILDKLLENADK